MAAEPPTQPPKTGSDIQKLLGLTPAVKPDDEEEKKEEEVVEKPKVMTGEEMARLAGVKYGPREEEEGKEGTAAWGRLLAREQQEEAERKEGRLSLRKRPGVFPPSEAAEEAPYLLDPSHPEYISEKEWIAQQEAQRTQASQQSLRASLRQPLGASPDPTLPHLGTPTTQREIERWRMDVREKEERYAPKDPQSLSEAALGGLEGGVRLTKDIVSGKPIAWALKKTLLDEETAEESVAASGEMTGMLAGLKYDLRVGIQFNSFAASQTWLPAFDGNWCC